MILRVCVFRSTAARVAVEETVEMQEVTMRGDVLAEGTGDAAAPPIYLSAHRALDLPGFFRFFLFFSFTCCGGGVLVSHCSVSM